MIKYPKKRSHFQSLRIMNKLPKSSRLDLSVGPSRPTLWSHTQITAGIEPAHIAGFEEGAGWGGERLPPAPDGLSSNTRPICLSRAWCRVTSHIAFLFGPHLAFSSFSPKSVGKILYNWNLLAFPIPFKKYFLRFYLFIFRVRRKEGERGRQTSMCGCLLCAPYWGPNLQPGMCPNWESNQSVTLWFAGWCSIH